MSKVVLDLGRVLDLVEEVMELRARHINWQPIETVPKDRPVILLERRNGRWDVYSAKWDPNFAWVYSWGMLETDSVLSPTHWCELEEPSDD